MSLIWSVFWTFLRLFCARVATDITSVSLLMPESLVSFVGSFVNASASWYFIPAPWAMSMSYYNRQNSHLASSSVVSAMLRIQFSLWWSVRTLSMKPCRYGRRGKTARTTVRKSRWVIFRFRSRSVKIFGQYTFGFSTFSSYSNNSRHTILRTCASLSKMYASSFLDKYNSRRELSLYCEFRKAVVSSLVNYPKLFGFWLAQSHCKQGCDATKIRDKKVKCIAWSNKWTKFSLSCWYQQVVYSTRDVVGDFKLIRINDVTKTANIIREKCAHTQL